MGRRISARLAGAVAASGLVSGSDGIVRPADVAFSRPSPGLSAVRPRGTSLVGESRNPVVVPELWGSLSRVGGDKAGVAGDGDGDGDEATRALNEDGILTTTFAASDG